MPTLTAPSLTFNALYCCCLTLCGKLSSVSRVQASYKTLSLIPTDMTVSLYSSIPFSRTFFLQFVPPNFHLLSCQAQHPAAEGWPQLCQSVSWNCAPASRALPTTTINLQTVPDCDTQLAALVPGCLFNPVPTALCSFNLKNQWKSRGKKERREEEKE